MKHALAPQPPVMPIIGNLHKLDSDQPVQSLMRLAGEYELPPENRTVTEATI